MKAVVALLIGVSALQRHHHHHHGVRFIDDLNVQLDAAPKINIIKLAATNVPKKEVKKVEAPVAQPVAKPV